MNFERKYIRKLLEELEDSESIIESLENEVESVSGENIELTERCKDLKISNNTIEKELNHLKTDIRRPAIISNPQTMDIFKQIKDGGVIKFIKPSVNKKYKNYDSNPFMFELDNKKAFFDGELLGLSEFKNGNCYYYHVAEIRKPLNSEIFSMLFVEKNFRTECKIKTPTNRGKLAQSFKINEILKMNPIVQVSTGKFITKENTSFIYTKNDGTEYILKEDGSEEVI